MFKRNTKSNQAGFIINVSEGQDIKFQIGDQSYYLMDILEELSTKLNTAWLVIFLSGFITIVLLATYTVPNQLANLSYHVIKEQTSIIHNQDAELKELNIKIERQYNEINNLKLNQHNEINNLKIDIAIIKEQLKHKTDN